MVHGTVDWGVTAGRATVYQLTDLAELAVRLGAIGSLDRRGDVIMVDDMEQGVARRWDISTSGSGSAVSWDSSRSRSGAYSAHLVAGDAAASAAKITHYSPYSALSAFGLECAISRAVIMSWVGLHLDLYDGANVTHFDLRWELSGSTLKYMDAAMAWQTLGTVPLSTERTLFHVFKLVGDAAKGEYARAIVNNQVFPMAGIAARVAASAILPVVFLQVELRGDSGSESQVWVDDAILTQNEPV